MQLSRCHYVVMGILRSKCAIDEIHGLTILEIHALEKTSKPNTIHKKIKELEGLGFVDEGCRVGKAKSYFLTQKGIEKLPIKSKEDLAYAE